jgi:hypothetical protein
MTIESGLGFPVQKKDYDIRDIYIQSITQGRILNGEPGDLDF